MEKAARSLAAVLFLTLAPPTYAQGPVGPGWYNGDWKQFISGMANWYLSTQQFARVYDNFVVPASGWTVSGVYSVNSLYTTSTITQASWEIRTGMSAGNGGTLVASGIASATVRQVSALGDGGYNDIVEVDGLALQLAPGTYWLSVAPVVGSLQSYLCPTVGANALGTPPGNDGNAYFNSPVVPNSNYAAASSTSSYGTAKDFSLGVLTGVAPGPVITAVVNAANFQSGGIAPGEIVTIAGTGIGPFTAASLTLDANGNVATSLGGVQVQFNGFAAPLIYVSATQINAVVPYQVMGLISPSVQVSFGGQTSKLFALTPAVTAPGLFTSNGSGAGPAAILNQDNSYNAPNKPAAKGSVVTLFMTGEGQTSPGGVTGKVTAESSSGPLTPQPLLPVTVQIGGQNATVIFYGEAPYDVAGIMQLNVVVPSNAPSGNVPVVVTVGSANTQNGVTISVQ